jgi:hypothetical protein
MNNNSTEQSPSWEGNYRQTVKKFSTSGGIRKFTAVCTWGSLESLPWDTLNSTLRLKFLFKKYV